MELQSGVLITKAFKVGLMSYSGMNHQQAMDYIKKENLQSLESKLKLKGICDALLRLYNKYFVSDHPLPTDSTFNISWNNLFWAQDDYASLFIGDGKDEFVFYKAFFDCVKEFHDTIIYNSNVKYNEDYRSYRPLSNKKFDDLTLEELSRDLLLFNVLFDLTGNVLFGFGKHEEVPYGKFKVNDTIKTNFERYKRGKDLTLEEIIDKYSHVTTEVAQKELGIFVKDRFDEDKSNPHEITSFFTKSNIAIFPATISNRSIGKLSSGSFCDSVEKIYFLGDIGELAPGLFTYNEKIEIIKVGKIGYMPGSFNEFRHKSDNGVAYIKGNGNPHYFAAKIFDTSMKHINLHNDTVEVCGEFISISKLESIYLANVRKIHNWAFCGAENLKEINLPDTLEELGVGAFKQSSISKLTIGKTLKVIPEEAFQQCDNLKEVYIPENITKIERDAFTYSENLKVVKVHVDTEIDSRAFDESVKIERYGTSKVVKETKIEEKKEDSIFDLFAKAFIDEAEEEMDNQINMRFNEDEEELLEDEDVDIETLFNEFINAVKNLPDEEKDEMLEDSKKRFSNIDDEFE